ncbi:MAG: signal recognition particle protein [Bdellovibrionales bacterium RIFOXYA1_FULL_36_14]|nr:MAG: signal recognition particle protein [Bdellovibrionales bacterium RIFOXYA1_FULL_36_14]
MFDILSEKFSDAFKVIRGKHKISEDNIEEALSQVKTALLEADVNFKVVKNFVTAVKEKAIGEKVIAGVNPQEQFIKIVHDELASIMGSANTEPNLERKGTLPILVVGLNGQGKTTFSGKLSLHLRKKKKKSVLLVPADTYRPAAKDQLITLAKSMDVEWFDSDLSSSPKEIALSAMKYATDNKIDVAIIDTAGRLHVDEHLMNELRGVKEALNLFKPEVLMVADAMTGQEAVNVAKTFHDSIGLTGVVLSKMDSDARGGAALSIKYVSGVPIQYISTGEKMKDLELFHPDRLAGRILDMGDVLSLVEKAEEAIDEKEAEKMMKRLEKNKFTVDDFLNQMNMISKLGPLTSIMKMIPGMGGMLRDIGDLGPAESEMKKIKVIISSMTKEERDNYKILNDSRIKRIARGSGNPEVSIKDFITKFKQMEKMIGPMMQMMKGGMPDMSGMGMPGGVPGMGPQKGFRQTSSDASFKKKKNKGKGNWGGGYFSR